MRKTLLNLLNGAAFGVGFTLILVIYIFLSDIYEESSKESDTKYIEADINIIQLSDIRLIKIGRTPSVAVKLTNKSNSNINRARINARLISEEGFFGTCDSFIEGVKSKMAKEELIECHNFISDDLPDDTSVKAEVIYVHIEK